MQINRFDPILQAAFENFTLRNNDIIETELNAVSAEDFKEIIREKHDNRAIHRATRRLLESESFESFASQVKRGISTENVFVQVFDVREKST